MIVFAALLAGQLFAQPDLDSSIRSPLFQDLCGRDSFHVFAETEANVRPWFEPKFISPFAAIPAKVPESHRKHTPGFGFSHIQEARNHA